ncbi:MAG: hypothetical protein WEA61_10285 [Anaerolineales bacterium]
MNKELRTGLVIVGVIVALVLVAYAAQAAGLTSASQYGMPGYGMQGGFAGMGRGGMMGGFQGSGYGMMAMMGGGRFGGVMMDPSQMPHWNQDGTPNFENCPYWQQQQEQ